LRVTFCPPSYLFLSTFLAGFFVERIYEIIFFESLVSR
jgi:hypothetical protein